MEQKLHTPEGVRDIYSRECEIKLTLQKKLNQVLHLYGYRDIQTPTFEYYDVFREEIGSTSTQELYKFFDREGNILALRPDITPSVARAAATLFDTEDFPLRFCYVGNTFINHTSYRGKLKENTQFGAELIGLDSVEAENPAKIWESNIFGKSVHELVNEGLHNKLYRMPEDARKKIGETIQRIINDGCNGLICIIL